MTAVFVAPFRGLKTWFGPTQCSLRNSRRVSGRPSENQLKYVCCSQATLSRTKPGFKPRRRTPPLFLYERHPPPLPPLGALKVLQEIYQKTSKSICTLTFRLKELIHQSSCFFRPYCSGLLLTSHFFVVEFEMLDFRSCMRGCGWAGQLSIGRKLLL